MPQQQQKRLEFLDSLRGLAAITVVLSHFVLAYRLDLLSKFLNYSPVHIIYDGFAAVTFFFVLSGYVLTLSLDKSEKFSLIKFYLKRVFRIMPAYWATLVLSVIALLYIGSKNTIPASSDWINDFWHKPLPVRGLLNQAFFGLPGSNAELVPQNWSLKVEMMFSFLIPFLYMIYKRSSILTVIIFNLVLYFVFNIPVFLFHFSFGMILALYQENIVTWFNKMRSVSKYVVIALIVLLYTYRYTVPMYYYYVTRRYSDILSNSDLIWMITGVGASLLLIYALSSERVQYFLNLRMLTFIGKISYAIYLVHMMVLIRITPCFISFLNHINITGKGVVYLLSIIVLLGITMVLSYLLYITVENPIAKQTTAYLKKIKINSNIYKGLPF